MTKPDRDPIFLARLFDFGFNRFIATTLIRILYVILMIAGLVGIAYGLFAVFQLPTSDASKMIRIGVAVGSPLIYMVYLIVIRLVCETLIVLFAIAEDAEEIRGYIKQMAQPAPQHYGNQQSEEAQP